MRFAFALLLIASAGVAHAQVMETSPPVASASGGIAPLVTPLHDADITYRLAGHGDVQLHQRMRWTSATWRQRIDPEGSATIMLTDYKVHKLMVLNTADHSVALTEAPGGAFSAPGTPASGSWRKVGPAVIAGEACTIWESADTDNHPTDFCYTDDGLLLGATQSGRLVVQAVSVARVPQDPQLFEPPEGYHRIESGH